MESRTAFPHYAKGKREGGEPHHPVQLAPAIESALPLFVNVNRPLRSAADIKNRSLGSSNHCPEDLVSRGELGIRASFD